MAGAGIFDNGNPFDASHPMSLFIIQLIIIIALARILGFLLRYISQPHVIAEVIGGILLGPTAFGLIPGFSDTLFPQSSLPRIQLVADIGLLFFLFLVGLELDPNAVLRRARIAVTISFTGIGINFAAGVGLSFLLYNLYADPETPFVHFMLFVCVSLCITAFPVLARMLTEKKVLHTKVGITVISAAAVDDLVSWILLAVVVSLVNAVNALSALWVFLTITGFGMFLFLIVRRLLIRLISRTEGSETASEAMVMFTFLLVLGSAFITEIIGVHAIFGAFMMGVIIPSGHPFAIKLTEKIEDFITILFVPLYFASSGLKTQIGLLNDALSWGVAALVVSTAIVGKIIGCSAAAFFTGLSARESFTVGSFMVTKGLVELIILNIGLEAGVISDKLFAILVVMALATTFVTMPLVTLIFPQKYQKLARLAWEEEKRNIDFPFVQPPAPPDGQVMSPHTRMLVVLDSIQTVPALANIVRGFRYDARGTAGHQTAVHAVRLVELTERTSTILKAQYHMETTDFDPVLNTFKAFLFEAPTAVASSNLVIADPSVFHESVLDIAKANADNMILLPFSGSSQRLERLFDTGAHAMPAKVLIQPVFGQARQHVCVFLDRGFGADSDVMNATDLTSDDPVDRVSQAVKSGNTRKVFVPFIGGRDDRLGLEITSRLAKSPGISIVVARILPGETEMILHESNPHRVRVTRKRSLQSNDSVTNGDQPVEARTPDSAIMRGIKGRLTSHMKSTKRLNGRGSLERRVSIESVGVADTEPSQDEDERAFRLFCEQMSEHPSSHITVRQHPSPWELAAQLTISHCGSHDVAIVGRHHPRLDAAAMLGHKSGSSHHFSLSLSHHASGSHSKANGVTVSSGPPGPAMGSSVAGVGTVSGDDKKLLGVLGNRLVRKDVKGSVMVVQAAPPS